MSGETNEPSFGRKAELEKAGYTPLKYHGENTDSEPTTVRVAESETYSDTKAGLEQAAAELANQRRREQQDAPPLVSRFEDENPDKPTAFEDVETAAEVLKRSRAEYAKDHNAIEQAKADAQLRDDIDRARGEPTQAERDQAVIAEDRAKAAKGREHQELMQQVADHYQANQARQQGAQIDAVHQRISGQIQAQVAAIAAEVPALRNIHPSQLPTALAALEQRDPATANRVKARLNVARQLNGQLQMVEQRRQQHANTEYSRWGKTQDQAFEAKHGRDANFREIAASAGDVLKDFGISAQEYVNLASSPQGAFLRDARVQSFLYEAAKARSKPKSMADLAAKRAPASVPPVVRPGSTAPVPRSLSGAALDSKLNKAIKLGGDKGVRALANILAEKRRAGR
jgi:hypothetical protein